MFLRRLGGPLLAAVKESTGLVGLDVVPNAREVLIGIYRQTLDAVRVVPDTAVYRKSVEAFTNERLKVCEEEEDWQKIEERIRDGQVEELIETARSELALIAKMADWKPWEVPAGYKVETIEEKDQIPAHVPTHRTQ
eukprot:TRINITY_DN11937_c0_g1_i1.p1 TRINITY_DN11937_c0_g1~~TRINITY_DN11937_c0_g1_i1.p1  ORF type:complete len:137 (+),score=28.07 TRINITY_DN11937_c0_g1_i1:88-498(+)